MGVEDAGKREEEEILILGPGFWHEPLNEEIEKSRERCIMGSGRPSIWY